MIVSVSLAHASCSPVELNVTEIEVLSLQQKYFQGEKIFEDELLDYGKAFLNQLCGRDYEGRKVGTLGWERAYSFLLSEIEEMGYNVSLQPFQTESGTYITNLIVTITGKSDSTIIVGAHFDGAEQSSKYYHYPAANDNGSGVTTLMLLLKDMSISPIKTDRTLKIALWGCEEVFEGRAFRGSNFFAQSLSEKDKSLVLTYINVDTVGHQLDENVVSLEHSGERRVEAEALRTKERKRFNYEVSKRVTGLYSDFASFYAIHVPYLNYHDHCLDACNHKLHTPNDIPEAVSIERLRTISRDIKDNFITY